ncbi:hypothetical protein POPTR_014G186308v4 [Populus trichocarpa]|uniref:Uncharacterized protein n=1 Tax=Populus trichocarpa TaxID=3694 RepID=A0ACC0RZW2_POPTR|nr:hypothetical protein POPTR_014G186308v4 [Populus trichocarpa]
MADFTGLISCGKHDVLFDVGLAPAAPSLSHAGGRPERGGPGPEGSPPAGERASQQGLSPAAASDVGLAPAAPSLSPAGGRPERGGPGPEGSPPAGERASQQGLSPAAASDHGCGGCGTSRARAQAPKCPRAPKGPRPSGPSAPAPSAGARVVFLGKRSSPAGKRVVDAGETSGHEAPHFSPSVAAALISPAAGLWAPGQRAPGPVRGHPPKEQ